MAQNSSGTKQDRLRPGVDFSLDKVERFAVRQSFSHEFKAKKLDFGERRKWIDSYLYDFRSAKIVREIDPRG